MSHLPLIVGFGGIGPAGRGSGHHAYRRLVFDALPAAEKARTETSLDALRAGSPGIGGAGCLVRRLEAPHFDTERIETLEADGEDSWRSSFIDFPAKAAGQLPRGVDVGTFYASRNHPRGLQLAIYAASDALSSLGIPWQTVVDHVAPDQICLYAGAAIAQMDEYGFGGLQQARYRGKRSSPKQLPLGLAEMPADFVNAYVLGNFGTTGHNMGACSTFLYNLQLATHAIRSGRARVAIAGAAESPLDIDVLGGLFAMGALAKDDQLRAIQGIGDDTEPDHRSACRPFGENCGMVPGESSQYVVLFEPELALELGANVLGAVGGVFVHADGPKKSITSPGVGNYISVAKCVAEAEAIVGRERLQDGSYIHAHGTGTPQNRVTESHILSTVSSAFDLGDWPVSAVKAQLGHSMAAAAGDQLGAALGFWDGGLIPGIVTTPELADDVHTKGLDILLEHREMDPGRIVATFLNAKGFGGNNATASVLAPHWCEQFLEQQHGADALTAWRRRRESTVQEIAAADAAHLDGSFRPTYRFGEGVLDGEQHVTVERDGLRLAGQARPVDLRLANPYA